MRGSIGIRAGQGRWLAALGLFAFTTTPARSEEPARNDSPPALRTPPALVEEVQPADLPDDPSSFTTVIDVDAYAGEAKTLDQIIGETVGVQVRRFGGPGDPAEISIRGSTASQVVVLLDGIRLNDARSGAVDLSTIPLDLVERIEISRGGGSVQTGSDAIGGVVNIITRRASGAPATGMSFTTGSWDTYQGSITQTGRFLGAEWSLGYDGFGTQGDWKFRASERVLDGRPQPTPPGTFTRVNNDRERHSALVRVARDLGDWGRIRLSDAFLHDEGGEPGPDGGDPPLLGQSLTARRLRVRNVADLAFEFADATPLGLDGDARIFHRFDRHRFTDPRPLLPIDSDQRSHALGGRATLRRGLALGPSRHKAQLGVELREDWLVQQGEANQERFVVGVFGQDDVGFLDERLRLIPALRFDDSEGFDIEWIPRFGVIAKPWPWLELKGNVERSYRIPSFEELFVDEPSFRGNPNLAPEEALNADVGLEMGFDRLGPLSAGWLEFALFRNEIDESISFVVANPFLVLAVNTGSATVRGLELAGGGRVLGWLGLSANWTLLDTKVDRTGLPLPGRPRHEVFARAELGPPEGAIKLIGSCLYTSDIPVTPDGLTRVSARTVVDLSLVLDLRKLPKVGESLPGQQLLFSVTANNLTDASVRDALFFPQPGRSLFFRVEWRR